MQLKLQENLRFPHRAASVINQSNRGSVSCHVVGESTILQPLTHAVAMCQLCLMCCYNKLNVISAVVGLENA